LGRIKSEEELRLISQNHATRREVNIAGVRYYNTKEAAEALGISYQTVRRRCLDPLFPEYFFEE
jgi:DNA-directed RNA polymerase specialized sigma24 family protein